jgi:hypothetical protein
MNTKMSTTDEHLLTRGLGLYPGAPFVVSIPEASKGVRRGDAFDRPLVQFQFTHQLSGGPQTIHFKAMVIAVANSITAWLQPLDH